jgi:predicted metal-dependent hydrolase
MIKRPIAAAEMATHWGTRRIEFVLQLEARRDLVITVNPDSRVHVRAPATKPLDHILRRIDARRSWIARQLREFESFPRLPAPKFISGETLLYLGREYRLRVERGRGPVVLERARLRIRVSTSAMRHAARDQVIGWYHQKAREIVPRRLFALRQACPLFAKLEPRLRLRRMARRWGSCTVGGTITIHPALIQAPPACIDYVLSHELVHLIEPSHSPRFHHLLSRAIPDWRRRRERLNECVIRWG